MPRAMWLVTLLSLGCAGTHLTTGPEPGATIDAMLLPPVDQHVALWINQPAEFAVIGVAASGADVLYRQTALEGVPRSGYVYVPRGDAGYDRVYLVASHEPIDLSGSLDDALAGASVVDAYAADTVRLDSLRCDDGRLSLVRRRIVTRQPPIQRSRLEEERFADCYTPRHAERLAPITEGREFFLVQRHPTLEGKPLPTGFKPPKVVPKPYRHPDGEHLERSDERTLR